MKCKTIVLWWLINDSDSEELPGLEEKDTKISALIPLVSTLFPGINYYSISGFTKVMNECVIPALKKRYPELLTISVDSIDPVAMTKVASVLPSNGYEWQDSAEWKSQFDKILAA